MGLEMSCVECGVLLHSDDLRQCCFCFSGASEWYCEPCLEHHNQGHSLEEKDWYASSEADEAYVDQYTKGER